MTPPPTQAPVAPRRPPFAVSGPAGALLVALLGMACLAGMDAVAKGLGASLPTVEIVLLRFAGTALIMAGFIAATRRAWPQRRHFVRHGVRGAVMAFTALLFFYGVTHLPLAVGTALAMSAPVLIAVLGVVVLKEPFTSRLGVALAAGLAGGAIIIAGGGGGSATGEASVLAWAAAILAPVSYAIGVILLKLHAGHEGAAAMTLAQALASALVALPFALPVLVLPEPELALPIVLLGSLGALGYLLMISALRILPASVFSLVDNSSLIWAAGLGLLIFGEVPGPTLWLGGALIIAACLFGARPRRPAVPAPTPSSEDA